MKKKRIDTKVVKIYDCSSVKINKDIDYFYEIGTQLTTDLAEAVAIMMRNKSLQNSNIWNYKISDLDKDISPEKCLYWLTGGDKEWKTLANYKYRWSDCYLDFQEEFGIIISAIIERSKTFGEVRDRFNKHLNLAILYDFAISREIA